ncbi:MAG: NAD(P)/FAD-dependent oxidoreductase [Chloroflexi bacterium]|jgi:L-2-hydroxyglutarate oxidase LhgO|nr:NAD(P)/FAD-dependent oxidoreductase [Chloroflexota bacterium]MBT7082024.1 NAD(P)/FAD-dependent oxidoreductase [Chloroflexota bacterium]MBT7289695.1 NAD(P)/FAD-dependent oxidoreductase [Chloroflexota bacterium]
MSDRADVTVIGAGVVGLAIAARLASKNRQIYVLEKNDTFGQETSSRNSEVIHSGIYYPANSLKAKTCVEGNSMMYQLCKEYGVEHGNLTKLVVATCDEEIAQIEELLEKGRVNGTPGLQIISKKEIAAMEPNIEAVAALHCPTTGVVDTHGLMQCLIAIATRNDAHIAYRSEVTEINKDGDGYEVIVNNDGEPFALKTRVVINCGGLHSDKVSACAGIDIAKAGYGLHYCKGEYFSVGNGKNKLVSRLIYPVPPAKTTGLGVHVTMTLDGRMRLGPSVEYVDTVEYSVDVGKKQMFYDSAKTFLPFVDYDDLEPEMAGMRPKLQGPGQEYRDFVIKDEADIGLPGLINLIGIESPGLTASPAIAKYVENLVSPYL